MSEQVLITKSKVDDIAKKIVNKAGSEGKKTLEELCELVDTISPLKNLINNSRKTYYLFYKYAKDNLNELIKYNDTENATDFSSMFYYCESTEFPMINTSNGTLFPMMYYYCKWGTSFPQIDTSKGTDLSRIYYGCSATTKLPRLNTDSCVIISYAFSNCYLIDKIDISLYKIASTSNGTYWCQNCYSLKALIIRGFAYSNYVLNSNAFTKCYHILGTTDATYNPTGAKDGYIYVPRDMIATLSSATNWSTHAAQFRALEDYTKDGTTTGEFDDEKAGI